MRLTKKLPVLLPFVLAACGGGTPAPPGLSYGMPDVATVTYLTGDTTIMSIDAMGQVMEGGQENSATVNATFEPAGAGVRVSLVFEELKASASQPMAGTIRADEDDVEGAMVFSLDRMGNVTIESRPDLSGNAEMLVTPMSTMYGFFPGLPGRGIGIGDMWVDTLAYSGEEGPGVMEMETVIEYTAVGDTVVDGRSLLKIEISESGVTGADLEAQGMQVSQRVEFSSSGWMLWDAAAGLLVERHVNVTGEGTVDVSMAPMPLPISVRIAMHQRLRR